MDGQKILLVDMPKGLVGEMNAYLLGMILVGKILMAALSRVDSFGGKMNDFFLYLDEFQNVTTDSIATILSEARKYRLSLNMAHQLLLQTILSLLTPEPNCPMSVSSPPRPWRPWPNGWA